MMPNELSHKKSLHFLLKNASIATTQWMALDQGAIPKENVHTSEIITIAR
jgi:hypothetical protein